MAKINFNSMVRDVSGKLEGIVFRRSPTGKMSMIKLADMSKVQWTEAQAIQRRRFKEAVAYAKAALADPQVRAAYEKAAKKAKRRAYGMAISDYFAGKNLLNP